MTAQDIYEHFGYLIMACDGYRHIGQVIQEDGTSEILPHGTKVVVFGLASKQEAIDYWSFNSPGSIPDYIDAYHFYKCRAE